jgi:hypothetical protein
MSVAPDPQEPLRWQSGIHTAIGEIGNGLVIHHDSHWRCMLTNRDEILHVKEGVLGCDAKAGDFAVTKVAKELQLQPGQRCEH